MKVYLDTGWKLGGIHEYILGYRMETRMNTR